MFIYIQSNITRIIRGFILSKIKINTINVYTAQTDDEKTQKLNEILIKLIKEHAGGERYGK